MLDNEFIQTKMEELWEDSNYGPISNPNPEEQRKEQAAIIQLPSNLPNGSILVQTHPYANEDLQLECIPGEVFKYRHRPGIKDRRALEKAGLE